MFSINFKRCLYFKFDTDFKQDGNQIFHTLIKVPAGKIFTADDCGKRRRFASVILLYVGLFVHHYILCFNHTACQLFLTRVCIHHIPKRIHRLRDESLFIVCVRLVRKWLTSVAAVINMKEGVSKRVSSVSLITFHPLVLCLMLSFFSARVHVEQWSPDVAYVFIAFILNLCFHSQPGKTSWVHSAIYLWFAFRKNK